MSVEYIKTVLNLFYRVPIAFITFGRYSHIKKHLKHHCISTMPFYIWEPISTFIYKWKYQTMCFFMLRKEEKYYGTLEYKMILKFTLQKHSEN